MQHAMLLARTQLERETGTKQIIMVTDGEPTAHIEHGEAVFQYPPSRDHDRGDAARGAALHPGRHPHQHLHARREPVPPGLRAPHDEDERGRAFFTSPDTLGDYVLVDFLEHRQAHRRASCRLVRSRLCSTAGRARSRAARLRCVARLRVRGRDQSTRSRRRAAERVAHPDVAERRWDGRNRGDKVIADSGGIPEDGRMRRIVILTFPGTQSLDVAGPLEVFMATERPRGPAVHHRGRRTGRRASSARRAGSDSWRTPRSRPCGARSTRSSSPAATRPASVQSIADPGILAEVRPRRRRVAPGRVGVLRCVRAGRGRAARRPAGRPPTGRLRPPGPDAIRRVTVEPDPIFVRDGDVYTSAGVTAGIDLCLALVEEDHGHDGRDGGRAPARRVPQAPGRSGAVQRRARHPARGS